jgi:hypothetical protein
VRPVGRRRAGAAAALRDAHDEGVEELAGHRQAIRAGIGVDDERDLLFLDVARHGERDAGVHDPGEHMHLVVFHELPRLGEADIGLAGRVLDDELDLAAAGGVIDLVEVKAHRVERLGGVGREHARHLEQGADLDGALLRCGGERKEKRE